MAALEESRLLPTAQKYALPQSSSNARLQRLDPCCSCEIEKSRWGPKVGMVAIHILYVGGYFLLDTNSIQNTVNHPWCMGSYLVLAILTLLQYFFTAGSKPGYVADVLHDLEVLRNFRWSSSSNSEIQVLIRGEASSYRTSLNGQQYVQHSGSLNPSTFMPISNRSHQCQICQVWQPLRSKHCYDCDKCVLRFDHHCVWLGTCIGQGNHCRFWWYICAESILCIWTSILYILSINNEIAKEWWRAGIEIVLVILLLLCLIILLILLVFHSYLVLTNQTTYELIRRRRIPYMRTLPYNVRPFSQGILGNLKDFCCSFSESYPLYSLPTRDELEMKARPYTLQDVVLCRCC